MNIFVIPFDRRFYDSHSFATSVWEEKNSDQSPTPLRSSAIPIITHQLNSLWSGF